MSRGSRRDEDVVTPSLLLRAYACGIFPMADSAEDPTLYWVEPRMRGVLPLDAFHVPRRLARTVRSDLFEVRFDTRFAEVIGCCAAPRSGRPQTWINEPIRRLYGELFRLGHVHTVETWREGRLVGGLYGVALGAAFFGESMFADERDASKVALVHLVAWMKRSGFRLLDAQFLTAHLLQFGAIEVPRDEYVQMLDAALEENPTLARGSSGTTAMTGAEALRILCEPLPSASAPPRHG
jgi:leucyl/phenylalanyl-tRNA---protein transferase